MSRRDRILLFMAKVHPYGGLPTAYVVARQLDMPIHLASVDLERLVEQGFLCRRLWPNTSGIEVNIYWLSERAANRIGRAA